MAKVRPYLGVFENMEFPDYQFREYPKVVGYRDGAKKMDPIIVNDQREEVAFITQGAPGAVKTREEELRDELERRSLELEIAKKQLEEMQAKAQEQAKAPSPSPAPVIAPKVKPAAPTVE